MSCQVRPNPICSLRASTLPRTLKSKQVGHALVKAYLIGDQVVFDHSTHGKPCFPFYEGDHGNDDLPFLSVGMPFTQRAIP